MLFDARHPSSRALTAARVLCVGLALTLIATTAAAVAYRAAFPYELEWMEGGTLVHIERLVQGKGLYVRPTLDFVPFAYPPLYYVLCVPLAWLMGPGFLAARLVSILGSALTLSCIFLIVDRHAGRVQAVIACGVFAGAYASSDAWLDLARVDATYLAWIALAWWWVTRAVTPWHWVAAGTCVWLAFLTKQPALVAMAPLGLYLLLTDRRAAVWFGVTAGLLSTLSFLALDALSDGWYRYYVVELPRLRMRGSFDGERLLTFWTGDILRHYPIALVLGLAGSLAVKRQRDVCVAVGLIATAWLARLEGGAWNNAVLPAYLAMAVLFGISLQRLGRWMLPVTLAAAAQLAMLLYDPRPFLPTPEDRRAGREIVERLRVLPPPLLVLDHNSWARAAGLREYAHGWAVTDVVWADRSETGRRLEAEVRGAIRRGEFATIVLDRGRSWFQVDVEATYTLGEPLARSEAYRPPSGAPRSPALVFLRTRGLSGTPASVPQRRSQ